MGQHMVVSDARRVLALDTLFDDLFVETAAAASVGWDVVRWSGSEAELAAARVVVHVRTRVDSVLLSKMPRCQVVGRFGTGLDSVDLDAARQRGVTVVGVRDYCTPELTAHTLMLAFALERQLADAGTLRLEAAASWDDIVRRLPIVGRQRATVVGFGTIGRAVTKALLAIGIQVTVVTQHGADAATGLGAETAALDAALPDTGMLFLHAALSEATRGMIDDRRLRAMPPTALLIDTARLGLIDEASVAAALSEHRLGGVALDARLAPGSPLARLGSHPQLVVTPHVGWYSARSARLLRQRTMIDSIAAATHGSMGGTE
jgi:phosphoglycerate dehydrogenase-like enzyme